MSTSVVPDTVSINVTRSVAFGLLAAAGFQRRPGSPPDSVDFLATGPDGPGNYLGPAGDGDWYWELDEATRVAAREIAAGER